MFASLCSHLLVFVFAYLYKKRLRFTCNIPQSTVLSLPTKNQRRIAYWSPLYIVNALVFRVPAQEVSRSWGRSRPGVTITSTKQKVGLCIREIWVRIHHGSC